jgi:glycosyltransferase involved in cell wall biosynthesis
MPKLAPYLVQGLRDLDIDVTVRHWGRRHSNQTLVERLSDRLCDVVAIAATATRLQPDITVLKTSHEWRTLIRDIPLLAVVRPSSGACVVQYHGSQPEALNSPGHRFLKAGTRLLLQLADGVLLLCSEEIQGFSQFSRASRYVRVTNPAVPLPLAECSYDLAKLLQERRASGQFVALFVGRIIRSKGVFDLLVAVAALPKSPQIHLVVVGEGKRSTDLGNAVRDLGLQDTVTLCGYEHGPQLAQLYHAADVLCLPTYWGEGFPTVITEAMSAGLPVITTRIRGAADYLVEGENALFVPARDPLSIAIALVRLRRDPSLCQRMSEANLRDVQRFSIESAARNYHAALLAIAESVRER